MLFAFRDTRPKKIQGLVVSHFLLCSQWKLNVEDFVKFFKSTKGKMIKSLKHTNVFRLSVDCVTNRLDVKILSKIIAFLKRVELRKLNTKSCQR